MNFAINYFLPGNKKDNVKVVFSRWKMWLKGFRTLHWLCVALDLSAANAKLIWIPAASSYLHVVKSKSSSLTKGRSILGEIASVKNLRLLKMRLLFIYFRFAIHLSCVCLILINLRYSWIYFWYRVVSEAQNQDS